MGLFKGKKDKNRFAPEKPKMSKKKKALIALAIVTLVVSGTAVWLTRAPRVSDENKPDPTISKDPLPPTNDPEEEEPLEETEDKEEEPEWNRKEGFYTFLILGTNDSYNTDVMMLVSLDVNAEEINVVSIPRDSMVDVPTNVKKINGVYGSTGIDATCEKVQDVTGVYPDYYVVINIRAFTKIVDVIGGVDFYVPYNMYMQDKESQYSINLRKGQQTLTANQALQLVRFRGTSGGDLDRIDVQKDFLMALLQQTKEKFTLDKVPGLVDAVFSSVKTSLDLQEMIWFLSKIYDINLGEDLHFHTLPVSHFGSYKNGSYVYLKEDEVIELVNSTVNPYDRDLPPWVFNIIIMEN